MLYRYEITTYDKGYKAQVIQAHNRTEALEMCAPDNLISIINLDVLKTPLELKSIKIYVCHKSRKIDVQIGRLKRGQGGFSYNTYRAISPTAQKMLSCVVNNHANLDIRWYEGRY